MAIGSHTTVASTLGADVLAKLQGRLRGELLRPGLPGYDAARAIFNAMIDKHPALIVRCKAVSDVQHALEFGRRYNLLIAVRGGGHNVAGKALCDDGIVIDLSPMKGVDLDPASRTIHADAGLTWGEFDRETQAHGLATTGGFISTTGIAGLTLGGGMGWLMRKHGLACDNLRSVRIVTADGQLLTAGDGENDDLFWGVRGGGGNFGIVTSFEYRLHPVNRMLAGVVFHPLETAAPALRFFRDFMAAAPDEVMGYGVFLTSPEGARMFAIPMCYAGPLDKAEEALRPLRTFGSPVADSVQPMAYVDVQSMFDAAFPPGRYNYWKSNFLRGLDDQAIDALVRFFAAVPSPHSALAFEPLGGAMGRVPVGHTAFPHRSAAFSLLIVGIWTDKATAAANIAWTREVWAAMQPFATEAVYVNYLDTDDTDRVQAAYEPGTFGRLQFLKRRYDPDNVFRVNQNIGPAS